MVGPDPRGLACTCSWLSCSWLTRMEGLRQSDFLDSHGPSRFCPGSAAVEELEDFINNINSVLESLYIEIKKGATEDDGRPVYALVSARRRPLVVSVQNCGGWRRQCPLQQPCPGRDRHTRHTGPSLAAPPTGSPALLSVSCAVIRAGGWQLSAHFTAQDGFCLWTAKCKKYLQMCAMLASKGGRWVFIWNKMWTL